MKRKEKLVVKKSKKVKLVHLDPPGDRPPSPIIEESSRGTLESNSERDDVHIPSVQALAPSGNPPRSTGHLMTQLPSSPAMALSSSISGWASESEPSEPNLLV